MRSARIWPGRSGTLSQAARRDLAVMGDGARLSKRGTRQRRFPRCSNRHKGVRPYCRSITWWKRTSCARFGPSTAWRSENCGKLSGTPSVRLASTGLLLSKDLRTHAGQVFLDEYGKLINLNASGQLAMRRMREEHLKRVEWDEWKFPIRLYPYVTPVPGVDRPIIIDARGCFRAPRYSSCGGVHRRNR